MYIQDLLKTLNSMKNIFQDTKKTSLINCYFFNLFKRCTIDQENKEMVLQDIHRVILQERENNSEVMQQADQNIDFIIYSTSGYQKFAQIAILSSLLRQYILGDFEQFVQQLSEFNSIIINQGNLQNAYNNQNTVQNGQNHANNTQVSQKNAKFQSNFYQEQNQLEYYQERANSNNEIFQQNQQQQQKNSDNYQESNNQSKQYNNFELNPSNLEQLHISDTSKPNQQFSQNTQQFNPSIKNNCILQNQQVNFAWGNHIDQQNNQQANYPQYFQNQQGQSYNQNDNPNNTYQQQQQNQQNLQLNYFYNQNAQANSNYFQQQRFSQNIANQTNCQNQIQMQRFQSHGNFSNDNNNNYQQFSSQQRNSTQGFNSQASQDQQQHAFNYSNPNYFNNQQIHMQGGQNNHNSFKSNNNSNNDQQQQQYQQQNFSTCDYNEQGRNQQMESTNEVTNFNCLNLQNQNCYYEKILKNGKNQMNFSNHNQQLNQQQNQRSTYYNRIKQRSQSGQLDTGKIDELKTEFFRYYNSQIIYYDLNQNAYQQFEKTTKLKALANSYRAMTKVKNQPREIQLISALCFLFKEDDKGRILQINTGEGKSIVVALLAATLAQLSQYVDVFTSNKILAQRDCEEFQKFYRELNLKANFLQENQVSKDKLALYQQNKIIYGEVSQFGGDYLADQHEKKNVRGDRKIDFCIVDEVDCMFIDQHGHKTTLAKEIQGLKKLEDFIYEIWSIVSGNSDCYEGDKIILQGKENEFLVANKKDFVLEKVTKLFFENQNFNSGMKKNIPAHLIEFAKSQFEIWIENAFQALSWKRDERYKVENNDIVMIDSDNTGQKYANMKYGKGMHQFLQLKENLQISPMTVQVNFVSHLYMFKLYNSNVFGLTGTLGTDNSVRILEEFYNLDAYEIPPFIESKLKIWKSQIYHSQQIQKEKILEQIASLKNQNRPCLLIYQNEREAKLQAKGLQNNFKVIQYYSDSQQIKEEIDSFCVIVSTNIAGRGTDFKISQKIDQNGGLHVILTFLPKNRRVDYQAFGRAGRCGQNGSAQMMICSSNDKMIQKLKLSNNNTYDAQELRDIYDNNVCGQQKFKMQQFYQNDQMFWKFSQILCSKTQGELGNLQRQQEEEYWGLFLETNSHIKQAEFNKFIKEMEQRLQDKKQNQSSLFLKSKCLSLIKESKIEDAQIACQEVIEYDKNNVEAQQLADLLNAKQQNYQQAMIGQSKIENILKELDEYQLVIQQSVIQSQIQNVEKQINEQYESYIKQSNIMFSQQDKINLEEQHQNQVEIQEEKMLHAGNFQKFKEERLIASLVSSVCQSNQKVLQQCIERKQNCNPKLVSIQELVKSQVDIEENNKEQIKSQTTYEDQNIQKFNQISFKTIQEFQNNNFEQVLVVQLSDGDGFFKRFGILIFGVIQIGVGFILLRTPFFSLSTNLIQSGISDLILGTKHLLNGENIDFKMYFSEKTISMLFFALPKFIQGIKCLNSANKLQKIPTFYETFKENIKYAVPQLHELAQVATKKSKFLQNTVRIYDELISIYPKVIEQSIQLLKGDIQLNNIIQQIAEFISYKVDSNLVKQVFQEIFGYSCSLLQENLIALGVNEICKILTIGCKDGNNLQEVLKDSVQNIFFYALQNITQKILQNFEFEVFFKTIAKQFMNQLGNNNYTLSQIIEMFSNIYHLYDCNQNMSQDDLFQSIHQVVGAQLSTNDDNVIQIIRDLVFRNFFKNSNQIPIDSVKGTLQKVIQQIQNNVKEFILQNIKRKQAPYQNQQTENSGFAEVLNIVGKHLLNIDFLKNNQQESKIQPQFD
ncbi:hypothetical protein ABPG72_021383 [Tetrahymena utriculariae]